MTRSSAEIERDVELARAGLDDTVEALKTKMSPGQLIDELAQSLKGSGAGDMFGNLGSQVKENPMALAMIGAGMTWLMMGKGPSVGGGSSTSSYGTFSDLDRSTFAASETDQSGGSAGGLKDKASDLAHGAAEKLGDAASHLKDGISGAAAHAKHSAQSMGGGAADLGQKVQRGFMDTLDQEPLVIGALGLAVGAAIGASLPASRLEDRAFGAARDQVLEKAKSKVGEGFDTVKDAAEAAYVGASDAAQAEGLLGDQHGSLVDKAENVIKAGVDAARGSVGRPSQA